MKLSSLLKWLPAIGTVSPCPTDSKLKATVPGYNEGLGTMEELHQYVLACPNIQSLDLRITLMGCSEWPDRWNFPFRLAGGDVYPNLTSLRLEGYRFDQNEWADALPSRYGRLFDWLSSNGLRKLFPLWRDTPKERRHLTNIQLWLEAMDWTKLETLAFMDGVEDHFVDLATPYLGGLKSLEVHGGWRNHRNATSRLISSLPEGTSLTHLSWVGGWEPNALDALIDLHGKTLQSLEIFSKEPWYLDEGAALTVPHIKAIAAGVPNIEHIALTIERNGSWPWDTLEALAMLPRLVSADIWLELAADCKRGDRTYQFRPEQRCVGRSLYRTPRLNATTATEVFNFLQEKKTGSALQNVTFYIGDWDRPWDGPLYDPAWLEGRKGKVECGVFDKDGSLKKDGEAVCIHVVDGEYSGDLYGTYGGMPQNSELDDEQKQLEELLSNREL